MQLLGQVLHFTEGYLVLKPSSGAPLLELDTKVCRNDGLVVGKIDDIFGSVENPHYSLVAYHRLEAGNDVFYQSSASILTSISRKRGTDASNHHDEETSEESSEEEILAKPKSFGIFSRPMPMP